MSADTVRIDALLQAGLAAREAGRAAEAAGLFAQAVDADPQSAEAQLQLGVQHLLTGQHARSVAPLQRAVALNPQDWRAHAGLGAALRPSDPHAALAAHDRAVALEPGRSSIHNNRGNVLLALGRYVEAEQAFEAARALEPTSVSVLVNLGLALFYQGRYADSLPLFEAGLARDPAYAAGYAHRAGSYMGLERWREALADYDEALRRNPHDAKSHQGRARALVELDFLEPVTAATNRAALASFDRAIELAPDFVEGRWSRALTRLRLGLLAPGWEDYEHRWAADSFVSRSAPQVTPSLRARLDRDLTREDLAGRRVLLVAEQGVGDIIMFASILPDLLAVAASAILICETRLHRLFAMSFPGLALLSPDDPEPHADTVLAIGSLGRIFRPRVEDIPGAPYLTAGEAVRATWAERLGPRQGRLRVGVSWRGGLSYTSAAARSIRLQQLAPVLDLPGCEFISLQYGEAAADLDAWNPGRDNPIRLPPGDTGDFEDLAALIQNLDLVVSVQTAVVHLSGATGTPCFVLIPRKPEWRYGARGEAMPWYGSVRLFRQGADGDWGPVVDRVATEVRRLAG